MAGIYVHIPFCKVKCHYCDFHFSTQTAALADMMKSMNLEIDQRKNYIGEETINTIYFGGGTPSFIEGRFLEQLMAKIRCSFNVSADAEITLECNPDDISETTLGLFKEMGVTRFSMGVQSFDDEVLKFMNRAHSRREIYDAIRLAKRAGFENITVDLIYGIPGKNEVYWKEQLNRFIELDVPHLSAYCLTIEPKTYFGALQKKGSLSATPDEQALREFQLLIDTLSESGFEQYEISNFAKPGFVSKHNSAYWLGEKYLGIGPSAHSYDRKKRGWNIANNSQYIKLVNASQPYHEEEILTIENRCNDYLLTRLRTKWGIQLSDIDFVGEKHLAVMRAKINAFKDEGILVENNDIIRLTNKGQYRADGIAADLFI